jgi:hypothetical protein
MNRNLPRISAEILRISVSFPVPVHRSSDSNSERSYENHINQVRKISAQYHCSSLDTSYAIQNCHHNLIHPATSISKPDHVTTNHTETADRNPMGPPTFDFHNVRSIADLSRASRHADLIPNLCQVRMLHAQ